MAKSRGKGQRKKSVVEKIAQARRTRKNKVKRYRKLLEDRPTHEHAKRWREKLEY